MKDNRVTFGSLKIGDRFKKYPDGLLSKKASRSVGESPWQGKLVRRVYNEDEKVYTF